MHSGSGNSSSIEDTYVMRWVDATKNATKISIFVIGWLSHFGLNCRQFRLYRNCKLSAMKSLMKFVSENCVCFFFLLISVCNVMRLWDIVSLWCWKFISNLMEGINAIGMKLLKNAFFSIDCVHWNRLQSTYLAANHFKKCF